MNSPSKDKRKFSIASRLKSFGFAWAGLVVLIKEEHNARVHVGAIVTATALGIWYHISLPEWIAIVLCFGLVLAAEAFNASIENLVDFVSPQHHVLMKKVKDLAAAGVLITAITAFTVGLFVFLPKIFQ